MNSKLPKSWKDITIKQFIEVSELTQKGGDDIDIKVKLLSIFTDKPEDYYLGLNYKEFNELCNSLAFLNNVNISEKLIYNIKVDGIKFMVNQNVSELSTAEYIDLLSYLGSKEKIQTNLHKILAIFIKPKHKYFGLKKVYMRRGEVADLFLNKLPITVAYPLCVFFCELLSNSIEATKGYLDKKMKELVKELKGIGSQQSGGGM